MKRPPEIVTAIVFVLVSVFLVTGYVFLAGNYVLNETERTQCEDRLADTAASLSAAEAELDWYYEHSPVHAYPCKATNTEPC